MPYTPLELAQAFMQTGELDDALEALNQHLSEHPDDEAVRLMRVETLMRMPDPRTHLALALDDLDKVTVSATASTSAQLFDLVMRKATIYERLNQPESALKAVQDGLASLTAPDDLHLRERLTERLVLLLVAGQAYAEARDALHRMPRSWRWLQWAGDIAAEAGNFSQAAEDYSAALDLFASAEDAMHSGWKDGIKARLLLVRGNAYLRLGDLTRAALDYEAGFSLVPDDPVVKFKRGLILVLGHEVQRGLAECLEAFHSAKPALRDMMFDEIKDDARYDGVYVALKEWKGKHNDTDS